MASMWPDEVDEVLAGDLTAALAYGTPAGGAVVTAVAPIGMRDRDAGTVTFSTSLGFGRKLDRIRRDPRVALAYHAREHGFSDSSLYALVQGDARFVDQPDEAFLKAMRPAVERFMGPPKSGVFWDRWLREYYNDRVPVHVDVKRVVVWRHLDCRGELEVHGEPLPAEPPPPQEPPKNGTAPRVDVRRAARRLRAMPHTLIAFRIGDGYPGVLPIRIEGEDDRGLRLSLGSGDPSPPGGRRAGLLGHRYNAKLIGLGARQHTGWLEVSDGRAVYAPHTEQGFSAPANKTVLLLANGLLAKRGLRKARKAQQAAAAPA